MSSYPSPLLINQGRIPSPEHGRTRQANKRQERLDTVLTNIGRPIPEREIINDNDYTPELVHDDSSVESDFGYSNNGSASTRCSDEDDIQTAENANDETEHGYSNIDKEHRRIAGANKKAKS